MAALRAGRGLEAERIAKQGLDEALEASSTGSLAVAQARFDLATIFIGLNDYARAIAQMRLAVALDEQTDAARRERLTFIMNLGEILQRAGELDEAEQVHRDGLKGRAEYYGEDHPGYAFGLEPLAEVLLGQKRYDDAKPFLTRCVEIFEAHQHPRLSAAVILEASASKAITPSAPALTRLQGASSELLHEVVQGAIDKAGLAMDGHYDPAVWLALLGELRQVMVDGGWTDAHLLTHVVAACSNLARVAGNHEEWANAYRWLIAHLDSTLDPKSVDARLGLAMALGEMGRIDDAVATYEDAVARAEKVGTVAHSGALRNFGLYLAEIDRRDAAAPMLEQAVAVARGAWGGGGEMLGRALVAQGIFVQHGGAEDPSALERARALLQEGISKLQPDHPDALPARSHLNAIDDAGGCGCGNMDDAISQALRDMVLPQLPEGLLDTLHYGPEGNLDVKLAREPSEDELELLNSVLNQAMAQLKDKLRSSGY